MKKKKRFMISKIAEMKENLKQKLILENWEC